MKTLSRVPRMLVASAALLLSVMYVAPVWSIRLIAPQYPEGLGLLIRLSTITGVKENDLRSINSLNHYIGMKPIEPSAIPELRYMPWIVAALIGLGLLAAVVGRRRLLVAWVVAFAATGAAGMYDFWRWGYDYGHNLDAEQAVIVVPGMTYQPPLIGTKQLLNFHATSLPHVGAVAAGVSMLLGVIALWVAYRPASRRAPAATVLAASLACAGPGGPPPLHEHHAHAAVPSGSAVSSAPTGRSPIAMAIALARAGDTIRISAGVHRGPTIVIDKPLVVIGDSGAVLDGSDASDILRIEADDVTVTGLRFQNVAPSHIEDRAAIRVGEVQGCRIAGNTIDNAFFGIYLAGSQRCVISNNRLRARRATEDSSGNGIHLWTAREVEVAGNTIAGHRDGIYLEFTHNALVRDNESTRNIRYGLHFMYSDDCRYERNVFDANGAGVAVMYTKRVAMTDNRFERSWGSAAYGLLLKEVYDASLKSNVFRANTTGLVADGATRLDARDNVFEKNGWGVRLLASTQDAVFADNVFAANTFDVATNSRGSAAQFAGNYWEEYRGYDLDRDGRGDVAHHPVRLFSMIVAANEPSLVLLRSPIQSVLDAAERAFPTLTPETLVDASPRIRRAR
jgi:nitrous oxidase accessory protein